MARSAVFDDAVTVTYALISMLFSIAVSRDDVRTETTSTERTPLAVSRDDVRTETTSTERTPLAASQDEARSERTFKKKGGYTVHMQPNSKKKGM